jgi:hypothetical protein
MLLQSLASLIKIKKSESFSDWQPTFRLLDHSWNFLASNQTIAKIGPAKNHWIELSADAS